ncbi:hypothetical protein [Halococcus saccharolyticus]|uniref:Uncharacterized protein n=1 Tax=Halococcus saccharolyticus DSM 5350 TaxID=1227455 RepID=M0MHI1_9EURY|nr:hypothetical protein [Halococcus saccharolyticus]EMA43880.1 hypothetical protein C449_12610 [Halococcus saccharolyticus DSM 5350]
MRWAQNFYEIQDAVDENPDLRGRVLDLVDTDSIHGKALEGNGRTESLRDILSEFFEGQIGLEESFKAVSTELPQGKSPHAHDNRVFAKGWDERLVRTQASRFYNQAVLHALEEDGQESCFIPHSDEEDKDSSCTIRLAGDEAEVEVMLDRLERTYGQADYHGKVKIPEHPHCTHTIVPSSDS